jgi:hypothetical protein
MSQEQIGAKRLRSRTDRSQQPPSKSGARRVFWKEEEEVPPPKREARLPPRNRGARRVIWKENEVPPPKREARLPPRNRGARRDFWKEEEEVPPPKREARLPPPNRVLGAAPPRAQEGGNSTPAAACPQRTSRGAPPAGVGEATMGVFVYEQGLRADFEPLARRGPPPFRGFRRHRRNPVSRSATS